MTTDEEAIRFINHALSCGLGMVFEEAAKIWNLHDFIFEFLNSHTYSVYFEDETLFSQSPRYVLQIFREELDRKQIKYPRNTKAFEEDVAHWMGFLLAQWVLDYGYDISKFTDKQYNWLYYGYDTLHTQSVKYVYEVFIEEKI